jgi:hypothetical protein
MDITRLLSTPILPLARDEPSDAVTSRGLLQDSHGIRLFFATLERVADHLSEAPRDPLPDLAGEKALAEVENDRLVDRHFRRGDLAEYMKRQRETPLSVREVSAGASEALDERWAQNDPSLIRERTVESQRAVRRHRDLPSRQREAGVATRQPPMEITLTKKYETGRSNSPEWHSEVDGSIPFSSTNTSLSLARVLLTLQRSW